MTLPSFAVVPLLSVLLFIEIAWSQISFLNMMEYQKGNLPNTEPNGLSTLYDQLSVTYRKSRLSLNFRGEFFRSDDADKSYQHLAQRHLEWENNHLKLRLGNYYTTLGRGLLLRAFELPNVIYEQRQFRRRYAYYRDMDGVLLEGRWQRFEAVILYGEPLDSSFPPKLENLERQLGTAQGGQITVWPLSWWGLGSAFLRFQSHQRGAQDLVSVFSQLYLNKALSPFDWHDVSLSLYAEQARENSQANDFFAGDAALPHATYVAVNLSHPRIGFSAEHKDYLDFQNDINLPPVLFKEHGYYLLNRSTHELLADNEKGYQFELFVRPLQEVMVLGNASYAENDLSFRTFQFAEKFAELSIHWSDLISSRTFYDVAKDEIKGERARHTGGVNLEWQFWRDLSVALDFQQQEIERSDGLGRAKVFKNTFAAMTVAQSPSFSVSYAIDRSTDLEATDNPRTPFIVEHNPVYWQNFVGTFEMGMANQISLFIGSRRGGISCLSGTCYEVLPFKGFEIRWISRF